MNENLINQNQNQRTHNGTESSALVEREEGLMACGPSPL